MFDQVYLWIQNLAFYMVMITALMHMIPNPEYRRYIRFFTGMVLVVMLAAPFLRFLDIGDIWQNLYESREYQEVIRSFEESAVWADDQESIMGSPAGAGEEESRYGETEGSGEIRVEEVRVGR